MKFSDFISNLYECYGCSDQGRFVLQIFAALCGEHDPINSSEIVDPGNRNGSGLLPDGLRGDETVRKALYGGKKYAGLSAPVKRDILARKNKDTFVDYSEAVVGRKEFKQLCASLNIDEESDRKNVFTAIFEQFLEFAKSKSDEVEMVMLQVLEAETKTSKAGVNVSGDYFTGNARKTDLGSGNTFYGNVTFGKEN